MSKPLDKAINIIGGQTQLAEALQVAQPTVWYWQNEAKRGVPAEYCAKIEALTKGAVTKEQLRPDIWGEA